MSVDDRDPVEESNAFLDRQRDERSTEGDRMIRRHDLYDEIDAAQRARIPRAARPPLAGPDDHGEPRLIPAED